ncbi:CPBP family intramembrane glutamic endopeptidase [Enterococcus sp. AZ163]|uniref:CPBP family intramembrane glutamic endopeptidase n=1 Tax=Enterococcus sp. AZ163 TaxID=2774638 RepID=UPI003D27FC9B
MKKSRYLFVIIQFLFALIPQIWIYLFITKMGYSFTYGLSSFFAAVILINLYLAIYFFEQITAIKLTIRGIRLKQLLYYTFLAVGLKILFGLLAYWAGYTTPDNEEAIQGLLGEMPKVIFTLFAVISGPILEELAARGFIMGYIFKQHKPLGFLVSVVLFTALHRPTSLGQVLIYLGPSIAFCWIYYASDRLEYSIAAHVINNLLVLL